MSKMSLINFNNLYLFKLVVEYKIISVIIGGLTKEGVSNLVRLLCSLSFIFLWSSLLLARVLLLKA